MRYFTTTVLGGGEVAMDAHGIYQRSLYLRAVLRLATRSASALTACSEWAAEQASTIAPRFERAEVIPNGVDPAQWAVEPVPNARVVAAWGRHVIQKGFDLLMEAWGDVRRQVPGANLLIGGEGSETPRLRKLAGEGVEFHGPLDKSGVQRLLAQSRIAVVPSRIEPFGIVTLEAMASGVPSFEAFMVVSVPQQGASAGRLIRRIPPLWRAQLPKRSR